jgi:hypothetical protein
VHRAACKCSAGATPCLRFALPPNTPSSLASAPRLLCFAIAHLPTSAGSERPEAGGPGPHAPVRRPSGPAHAHAPTRTRYIHALKADETHRTPHIRTIHGSSRMDMVRLHSATPRDCDDWPTLPAWPLLPNGARDPAPAGGFGERPVPHSQQLRPRRLPGLPSRRIPWRRLAR